MDNFRSPNISNPYDSFENILTNNNYVMDLNNESIRFIFSPHPMGSFGTYKNTGARDKIVNALKEEYDQGNLGYDSNLKHFERTDGPCGFCDNSLFYIGECAYGK